MLVLVLVLVLLLLLLLEPVMINYSAEISACEKGQKWEQALSLLEDWCETSLSQV